MTMDNFLIIRLSSLGDVIHTLPAFAALRKHFPEAKISWLVEPKGKEILACVPGIDKIITAPPKQNARDLKKYWKDIRSIRNQLKSKNLIAIDFQGLIKSAFLSYFSGAKTRIGFHRKNLKEPAARLFYTEHLKEVPEDKHVILKNLRLLTLLGINENRLEFPLVLPEGLIHSVREKLNKLGYSGQKKLVIINVGAAWKTKRWFPESWAKFIRLMEADDNVFFLILWGNDEEKAEAKKLNEQTGIPLVPPLSLQEVMVLVKESSVVITGDTFALQAASAFLKPVVAIFGPTNPRRNGPFHPQSQVAFHELNCSYCYKRKCQRPKCLKKISPEEIAALSRKALKEDN